MINGGNAAPRHGGGRDDPGAQREQRGYRTATPDAGPTHDGSRYSGSPASRSNIRVRTATRGETPALGMGQETTHDRSGYSGSPASRSNMRVRTTTGGGTPTLDVGQEGTTHAEPAHSGQPVATGTRQPDRAQPRQRDARRVPAAAAEHNTSASSPSRAASGATERRGAPSPARRRDSNSTTTADTPSPSSDDRTPRSPRPPRSPRSPRSETTAAAATDEQAGRVDQPMTAPARTQPTKPSPTGGRRPRPLTAAVLSRRNAKPDQVEVTHPVREPDDPPAPDRTEPDPNGDPEPAALSRPHPGPAPTGRTPTDDPVKPARRHRSNSTTTADTPSPSADDRTPRSPRPPRSPRSPRSETTAAAATDEAGPVDKPRTASARTQTTKPRPTGGARPRPLTAAVLARRNAKPDQPLGLRVAVDRVRIGADRAGLLGGLLVSSTSGAEAAADRLETSPADVTHPVRDPDVPAHDRTQPEPNGDPESAARSRPHPGPAPAGRTPTDDPVKPARRHGSNSTTTTDTPSPSADDRTRRSPRPPRSPRSPRSETTAAAATDEQAGPVDEPRTASARPQPTKPRPTGGARPRPLTAAVLARRNAKPDQAEVTHAVPDPNHPPAHDRTEPDPNGDPQPAALSRPHPGPAPAGRIPTDDPFELLIEFMTLPPRIAVAYWSMAMEAARPAPRRAVPGPNGAAGEHETGSADR
jgi:hypothetical protein